MDWSQVRISFLIATLPGLLIAIHIFNHMDTDSLDRRLIVFFAVVWLSVLFTYILPLGGGQ